MPRPKTGRKTYSHSVSLTPEEIEFLSQFPNSSETLRKILDDIMRLHQENKQPEHSVLVLKHEIDLLEQQLKKLLNEQSDYAIKHDKELYEDGLIDRPLDTEEARYHRKIIDSYNDAILSLESQIRKQKKKIMQS